MWHLDPDNLIRLIDRSSAGYVRGWLPALIAGAAFRVTGWPWASDAGHVAAVILGVVALAVVLPTWRQPFHATAGGRNAFEPSLARAASLFIWPFAIIAATVLAGFTDGSLESDDVSTNVGYTLWWAFFVACVVALVGGASATANRVREIGEDGRKAAELAWVNWVPVPPKKRPREAVKIKRRRERLQAQEARAQRFAAVVVDITTRTPSIWAAWLLLVGALIGGTRLAFA